VSSFVLERAFKDVESRDPNVWKKLTKSNREKLFFLPLMFYEAVKLYDYNDATF